MFTLSQCFEILTKLADLPVAARNCLVEACVAGGRSSFSQFEVTALGADRWRQ